MSVPAEEMARRRVPVARPAVQQLALPPPTAAPPSQLGTPPPTTVPPSGNTVMVDSAGRASVSNIQPRAPATSGGMADFGGQAGRAARAANAATGLPGGSTLAPGSTVYVDPAGTARAGVQLGEAGQRARAAAGAPQVGPTRAAAAALGAQPAAPAAAAPAGSTAFRAGQTAGNAARALSDITGTAARLGTAPVPSAPGRLSGIGIDATARGTPRAGTGGFLAGTGILSALDSLGTPTEDYALRTGIQNTGVGTELANRTLGTLSDFGAALVDTGVWAGNKLGQGVQAVWPGAPEALTRQMPYLRDQFTDVQARANGLGVMEGYQQPSAAALAAAPPLPGQAPAADFSNVTASVSGGGGATPSGRGRSLGTFTGERTGTREVFEGEEVARSPNARGTFNVIPAYQGTAARRRRGATRASSSRATTAAAPSSASTARSPTSARWTGAAGGRRWWTCWACATGSSPGTLTAPAPSSAPPPTWRSAPRRRSWPRPWTASRSRPPARTCAGRTPRPSPMRPGPPTP